MNWDSLNISIGSFGKKRNKNCYYMKKGYWCGGMISMKRWKKDVKNMGSIKGMYINKIKWIRWGEEIKNKNLENNMMVGLKKNIEEIKKFKNIKREEKKRNK